MCVCVCVYIYIYIYLYIYIYKYRLAALSLHLSPVLAVESLDPICRRSSNIYIYIYVYVCIYIYMASLYLSIKLACLHVEVVDTSGATVANWTQPLFVFLWEGH